MTIPATITAGDSLRLSVPAPDNTAADGWALALVLVPADGSGTRLSASTSAADPDNAAAFLLTVAASATAAWAPRAYTWALQASRLTERTTLQSGRTTVLPDPAAAGTAAMDLRSVARKTVDAIDAYLSNPANLNAASYSIAGRSLNRWPRAELIVERSKWLAELAPEDAAARLAAGLGDCRRIYVRFGA